MLKNSMQEETFLRAVRGKLCDEKREGGAVACLLQRSRTRRLLEGEGEMKNNTQPARQTGHGMAGPGGVGCEMALMEGWTRDVLCNSVATCSPFRCWLAWVGWHFVSLGGALISRDRGDQGHQESETAQGRDNSFHFHFWCLRPPWFTSYRCDQAAMHCGKT